MCVKVKLIHHEQLASGRRCNDVFVSATLQLHVETTGEECLCARGPTGC